MARIEIDDDLYARIAKVAEARGYPESPEHEVEKAIAFYLVRWEDFLINGPAEARKANFPKGDAT